MTTQTAGPVRTQTPDADMGVLAGWFNHGEDTSLRDEYLAERGWLQGEHLEHSECPIDPEHVTTGKPVLVGDLGLFCHNCQARGKTFRGNRRPGFASYAALAGGSPAYVAVMARNAVHWHQAKHTLLHLNPGVPEEILRLAYRALLKLSLGVDDPRVPAAMSADQSVIRLGGQWYYDGGRVAATRRSAEQLAAQLPACAGSRERQTKFANGGVDLSEYGYSDLYPVHGCRVWGRWLDYPRGQIPVVLRDPECPAELRPKYLAPSERMSLGEVWATLHRDFPGLDTDYLQLILCAAAMAEGGREAPVVFATGPTGVGKTVTVQIAASIRGTGHYEAAWDKDSTRFSRNFSLAAMESGLLAVSELFKDAKQGGTDGVGAAKWLLNFSSDLRTHVLHVGPVKLGRLPATILTDSTVPPDVKTDPQTARRLTHYHLGSHDSDWKATSKANGVSSPGQWRATSGDRAHAADSLLSHISDAHFAAPPVWAELAREFGAEQLDKSDAGVIERQLDFFRLVCEAPALTGSHAVRYGGRGWKLVCQDHAESDLLSDLYADAFGGEGGVWSEHRLGAVNWQSVLAAGGAELRKSLGIGDAMQNAWQDALQHAVQGATLDTARHGKNFLYVRFLAGGTRKNPERVNRELLGG